MPTRRNRSNGPVSRLLSPVNEGLGVVTNVGSTALRTGNSVWKNLGRGARSALGSVTGRTNAAARRLLTGKRGGAKKNSRKNRKTRKNRKNRK